MARLPSAVAAQAEEAEGTAFAPLEPGIYIARLAKVEVTQAKSGNPMWKLEFDDVRDLDDNKKPGRQFTNLVLIDTVAWKIKQFYDAFGVSLDTDTDELLGERIRLQIAQRVIEQGNRAGQLGNEVNAFLPLDENAPVGAAAATKPAAAAKAKAKAAAPPAQTGDDF